MSGDNILAVLQSYVSLVVAVMVYTLWCCNGTGGSDLSLDFFSCDEIVVLYVFFSILSSLNFLILVFTHVSIPIVNTESRFNNWIVDSRTLFT